MDAPWSRGLPWRYGSSGRVMRVMRVPAESYKTSHRLLGSLVPWRDVRHCERDSAGTHRLRETERDRERDRERETETD